MAKQKLLTAAIRKQLPTLYAQEDAGDDAIAYVKFFTPWTSWTWWATEASGKVEAEGGQMINVPLSEIAMVGPFMMHEQGPVQDVIFFGLVDGHDKELGYFSLNEMQSVSGPGGLKIERDRFHNPTKLSELMN
jgi:hypothetical protein